MEHLCRIYKIPSDYRNPIWHGVKFTPKALGSVMTHGWISGFTEGDGSFYITIKDKTVGRYSHGFGFSQKLDHNV